MKRIKLSQNKYALVDDEDYGWLIRYKWHYNNGYAKTWYDGKRIRMHRLIMNAPDGVDVDHINGDKLDCRKENLRLCTKRQNNQNVRLRKNNTTGYKGVTVEPTTGHYRPNIYKDGKAISFGQFLDPHYAALARDLWAVDMYGEFASTNFPVISSSAISPK